MNETGLKTEKTSLKEIENDKYRDYYLVYNRKSTDEPDNQKNSISYQKSENTRFALQEKLPVALVSIKGFCTDGIISEKHSGFKEDNNITITDDGLVQYRIERPKFHKMLQLISRGYFKGLVCLCWDRISRNKGDDSLIQKLMRKGVDIRFTYAKYDKTSAGELHKDIDGMFSQHHSRVTSEKVTLTMRNAREKGICTYKAPIGYLNLGEMEHKPPDSIRAPIIKQMFEYYATGDWSLSDLVGYAREQGLVTVPRRKRRSKEEILLEDEDEEIETEKASLPMTKNHISRILRNPFYIGRILNNENKYISSTSHEAIINDELFNTVQSLLKKRTVSIHYTEKLDLPLRGILRCEYCKRVYTPYVKKGINYFNSRCITGCSNSFRNFNFKFIVTVIGELISTLYFTENEIAKMDSQIGTDLAVIEVKRKTNIENIERKNKKILEDLTYLNTNKLSLLKTGVYSPEAFITEENNLNDALSELKKEKDITDIEIKETMKDIYKLSELVKNLVPYYYFAKPKEKEKITRIIFSELYVSQNMLNYKCKKGFECFANRFDAICAPIAWLSELVESDKLIKDSIHDLQDILLTKDKV